MNEEAVKRAISSAIRETVQLCFRAPRGDLVSVQQTANEYAQQLIMPPVEAAVQQALEEGFAQARNTRGVAS